MHRLISEGSEFGTELRQFRLPPLKTPWTLLTCSGKLVKSCQDTVRIFLSGHLLLVLGKALRTNLHKSKESSNSSIGAGKYYLEENHVFQCCVMLRPMRTLHPATFRFYVTIRCWRKMKLGSSWCTSVSAFLLPLWPCLLPNLLLSALFITAGFHTACRLLLSNSANDWWLTCSQGFSIAQGRERHRGLTKPVI